MSWFIAQSVATIMQRSCAMRAIFPARLALLDEGADAFLGVARQHVLDHHLGGVVVGLGQRHFDLAVERLLADLDGRATISRRSCCASSSASSRSLPGATTRLTRPMRAASSAEIMLAGEQHLHRVLARHVARQRHHRRRAEQADIDAGRGELRGCARRPRDRSSRRAGSRPPSPMPCTAAITGCGSATICCIMALQRLHDVLEIGAAAVGVGAARGQLLEVVAGARMPGRWRR